MDSVHPDPSVCQERDSSGGMAVRLAAVRYEDYPLGSVLREQGSGIFQSAFYIRRRAADKAVRPDPAVLRIEIEKSVLVLSEAYSGRGGLTVQAVDYLLGFSSGAQSSNKGLPQNIGWQDYNNGGAMGTFDPLAE